MNLFSLIAFFPDRWPFMGPPRVWIDDKKLEEFLEPQENPQ